MVDIPFLFGRCPTKAMGQFIARPVQEDVTKPTRVVENGRKRHVEKLRLWFSGPSPTNSLSQRKHKERDLVPATFHSTLIAEVQRFTKILCNYVRREVKHVKNAYKSDTLSVSCLVLSLSLLLGPLSNGLTVPVRPTPRWLFGVYAVCLYADRALSFNQSLFCQLLGHSGLVSLASM